MGGGLGRPPRSVYGGGELCIREGGKIPSQVCLQTSVKTLLSLKLRLWAVMTIKPFFHNKVFMKNLGQILSVRVRLIEMLCI